MLGERAQRLEKLRGQQQNQQPGKQGQILGRDVGDIAKQTKPDVDGDNGDGHRGKELQNRRGQKSDPERFHGDAAVVIRALANELRSPGRLAEELQGGQAAHLVQELAGKPANGFKVLLVQFLRAHAHQGHE